MCRRFLLLLFLLVAGCSRSGHPVEIIVPTGFTGPIWIVEDAQKGKPIPLVGGRYRVEVPEGGVLTVSSTDLFQQWHSESARFADGTTIPVKSDPPDDAVVLRGGGYTQLSRDGREFRFLAYYVGTKEAAKPFLEEPSPPPE